MTVDVHVNEAEGEVAEETAAAVVETEAAEAVADAAVEIAEIEADRDVQIAELHAENERLRTEALSDKELEECRTRISTLEAEKAALETELTTLRLSLIPPNTEEAILSSPSEPDASEVTPDNHAEPVKEPAKPSKPHYRWI